MIIIGCDLHTRSQQIAMLDTETGEVIEKRVDHESGEAKRFYEGLKEPALVGIESTGYTRWFAEMLAELGHELVVGEAGNIRTMEARKQKHDRRDAEHILNLLVRGDFPKIWLPSAEERDGRVLWYFNALGGVSRYFHVNALGSLGLATNQTGAPVEEMLYYPFGGEWQNSGLNWDEKFARLQTRDVDIGTDMTNYRLYKTILGRWMTPDPVGGDVTNPQSLNRYAYVTNNPASLNDPLGLFESCDSDPNAPDCEPPPGGFWNYCDYFGLGCDGYGPYSSSFFFFFYVDAAAGGGGGGGGSVSPPPAKLITWPQLQTLVAQNNESNLCDDVIDCIVFRESHIGKSGVPSGLGAGFNAGAISSTEARGLMQVEKISLKDVLTAGNAYPVPAATLNRVWGQMFNPALNIEAGSNELQLKINRANGNLQRAITAYGPVSGDPNYADDVLNCVKELQAGQAGAAYAAATAHN